MGRKSQRAHVIAVRGQPRTWDDLPKADGDRLICEICQADFANLQAHVWQTHEMLADDYRRRFRVASNVPLLSATTRQRIERANRAKYAANPQQFREAQVRSRSAAARSRTGATRRRHAADGTLRTPGGGQVQYQCRICGARFWHYASDARTVCFRQACTEALKVRVALENRQSVTPFTDLPPEQQEEIRTRLVTLARANADQTRKPARPCKICGAMAPHPRRVCSERCLRESRRRQARLAVNHPRKVPKADWPILAREATQGTPRKVLADRYGVSVSRINQIVLAQREQVR